MNDTLDLGPYEAREFVVRHAHGGVCRVSDGAGDSSMTAKLYAPTGTPTPAQLDRWHDEFAAEVDALRQHGRDLVPIRDRGRAGEMAWVVTDAPQGRFLSELLEAGPLAAEPAIGLVGKIAAALDRMHRSNLVHRSLKPSNIVIDADGEVQFMDAVLLGRLAEAILAGSLPLDRVACVAPESVLGYRQRPASNVHALAVIAYRALCGHWPHDEASSVDYAYACVYNDHVPLTARDGRWSVAVEEQIARGLAKEPDERFGSCTEFADALASAWSRPEPLTARADAAGPSAGVRPGPRLVEDPVDEPPETDAAVPQAEEPALAVVEIAAADLQEVETLIPDLEALPAPELVDPEGDGAVPLPDATAERGEPDEAEAVHSGPDEAEAVRSEPEAGPGEPEDDEAAALPAYPGAVRGPGAVERMRTLLRGALARWGSRAAGKAGSLPDHRLREDYLADWRARMATPDAAAPPAEDPVVPEWSFRVEPEAPAWLRIDGRYAGPAPAEVTIRGRAGSDIRVEVMRDGACIAEREMRLHPLMDKVWDLRADS